MRSTAAIPKTVVLLFAAGLAACEAPAALGPENSPQFDHTAADAPGWLEICAHNGSGSYSWEAFINDASDTPAGNGNVNLGVNECRQVFQYAGFAPSRWATVSQTAAGAGYSLQSVRILTQVDNGLILQDVTTPGITTVTSGRIAISDDISTTVTFNYAQDALAGCTPGFWRQSQHFAFWTGYTTGQSIGSVFTGANQYSSGGTLLSNMTLLDALTFGGGKGLDGAAQILLRAGVAALLNAASPNVDYGATAADVIGAVNAALGSQNRGTMLSVAEDLDADNNRGCTAQN